jgi:hypothetical protein
MRIFAICKRAINFLIGKDVHHPFHVKLLRVKFEQSRREFNAKLGGVQEVAIGENEVHPVAELIGIVARSWREGNRNEAETRNLAIIQIFGKLASTYPGSAQQFKRSVGTTADRDIRAFDQSDAGVERSFGEAA